MNTNKSLSEGIARLHANYILLREGNYPFPAESALAFYFLLSIQESHNIRGDILELGVEHGGTALLLSQALNVEETLNLVDIQKTERFEKSLRKLSGNVQTSINYNITSTTSPELEYLTSQNFRFIHIDAGHQKQDVIKDSERFAHILSDRGITCFDDVYEIRWPGVTEAVYDYLPRSNLEPFMLCNRKLYCCKREDYDFYFDTIQNSIDELEGLANMTRWVEKFIETPIHIFKIQTSRDFFYTNLI